MKKFLAILTVLTLIVGVIPFAVAESVDAYTSASTTKAVLSGDDLTAAAALLVSKSADLATLAESEADGYAAPESAFAQIMSVNPDGSVGLSTISQWKYVQGEDGLDQVIIQLTYGQNAVNLATVGNSGSLLVAIDGTYYIVHLTTAEVVEMPYSDEDFNAGKFNAYYSGAEAQLTQYDITLDVGAIETTSMIMF